MMGLFPETGKIQDPAVAAAGRRSLSRYVLKNYHYYILVSIPIAYFLIFKYGPMFGNIIAFRRYRVGMSLFGEQWVGLKYFKLFFFDPSFWNAFMNSLILSVLNLIVGFPLPIVFALLLNEITSGYLKRFVQTVSYLPRFMSTVIVVGMIKEILSPSSGIVNHFLEWAGIQPIFFVNSPEWFRPIYILSDIWQYTGWNAIIYIAALTAIDIELYEASKVDGASRMKQTLHVTLPGIMPTIIITLILSVGQILSLGFDKVLLLWNVNNSVKSDIIDTFVFRIGIQNNNYSYATAVGLFGALIGLVLIYGSNFLSRRISDTSLF